MTTRTASSYARRPSSAVRRERPQSQPHISISNLRDAIQTLDTKMAALLKQRQELESHLEQAVRSQSPVLRIPSELLSSIFVAGVLHSGDENPVMVSTLMLVCRYWAEVALDSPVLWSKISVGKHQSLEKVRRKLSRSKSWPLDVSVNFGPHMDYSSGVMEQVIHAMDLIRPAIWRTRSFSLTVPNKAQAHAALLRCQEEAPMLESMSIQIHHAMPEEHYTNPPLPLFKGHTPRLQSCSFTSFHFGWDPQLVSRLTVLKLGGYFNGFAPSFSTLLSILRQCPDLQELALRNMSDVDSDLCFENQDFIPPVPPLKLIQLPKLRKVSFYYSGIALARQVLSHITFPNLQSLELCCMENVTPVLQILYTQALTRLPLRHLRVESAVFNEMKFMNLLRRLPSLVGLELVDVEDASIDLLKALSSSQPWMCPRLQVLSLDGCTSFDWDSLRTCVESRLPAHSHMYPTYQDVASFRAAKVVANSASAAAARGRVQKPAHNTLLGVERLREIDVTRCNQISREMVQWLRMYVTDVRCEPAKGVWGDPMLP